MQLGQLPYSIVPTSTYFDDTYKSRENTNKTKEWRLLLLILLNNVGCISE